LNTIGKQDVLSLFLSRVHPSSKTRSKLSIHAQSQKSRPKHISRAAADAFARAVQEYEIQVEEAVWSSSLFADGEPMEAQFSAYWKNALADAPDKMSDSVFTALPHLMERFPAEKDAQGSLTKDATHIDDIQAFKKSLKVSEYPMPLVSWDDMLTSKF
jgi:insulysin